MILNAEVYRQLVEAGPDAMVVVDPAGKILIVNQQTERLFGYSRAELLGRDLEILVPDKYRTAHPQHRDNYYSEPLFRAMGDCRGIYARRKDGTELAVEISLSPIVTDAGLIVGSAIRDITARTQAQDALRESEARLAAAERMAHLGNWERDITTGAVTFSDELYRIFGWSQDELEPSYEGFLNAVHEDDRPVVQDAVKAALKGGRRYDTHLRIVRPDGSQRVLHSQADVAYDSNGKPTGMVGTALDITERVALERQVALSQRLEAVGQLAAGVAHDFNNLLTVITGFAELVMESLGSSHAEYETMEEILKTGHRAAALAAQLLAVGRKQILEPKMLDLSLLVEAQESILRSAVNQDIELDLTLEPKLRSVNADPGQLERVLLNLVLNAVDAMPRGGQLSIKTKQVHIEEQLERAGVIIEGSYAVLEVSDTGNGISQEAMERIFEPFFTTKERGKGTGLGLATVYGIVKQSGGYIFAESEVGAGTTFTLYLPAVEGNLLASG